MVEADTFCLMGLFFAAFVSLSSMSMYWFFEVMPGMEWLADTLVILWVGLFGWALTAQWEATDPPMPCDDLSYCAAHADNVPPDEPGPPPAITVAGLQAPPAG